MRRARAIGCLAVIALALSGACGRQSTFDEDEVSPEHARKFIPEAEAATAARERAFRDELTAFQEHPWAGEYYYGDGLGVNVRLLLTPQSGFVFQWRGCLGVYDRNHGAV